MEHATEYAPVRPLALGAPISHSPRGRWRALAALVGAAGLIAATAVAAYGSRDPVTGRRGVSGTWAVSTAAGQPLPATVVDTGLASPAGGPVSHLTIVVTGGTLRLTSEGTYTAQAAYTLTLDRDSQLVRPRAERGSYTLAGSTITFLSPAGRVVATGTLADGSLTLSGDLLDTPAIRRWCAGNACTARPSLSF